MCFFVFWPRHLKTKCLGSSTSLRPLNHCLTSPCSLWT